MYALHQCGDFYLKAGGVSVLSFARVGTRVFIRMRAKLIMDLQRVQDTCVGRGNKEKYSEKALIRHV